MKPSFPEHFARNVFARVRRPWQGCALTPLLALLCYFLPASVQAAWNTTAETLQSHPTWIYTPSDPQTQWQ